MLRRLLAATSLAVALVACGASTASQTPSRPTPPAGAVTISLTDFAIMPSSLDLPAGKSVVFVSNDGKTPHNFTVRNQAGAIVAHSRDLNPGQADVVTIDLPAGDFTFFCAFAGHEQLGMSGGLTVQ